MNVPSEDSGNVITEKDFLPSAYPTTSVLAFLNSDNNNFNIITPDRKKQGSGYSGMFYCNTKVSADNDNSFDVFGISTSSSKVNKTVARKNIYTNRYNVFILNQGLVLNEAFVLYYPYNIQDFDNVVFTDSDDTTN